MKQLKSKITKNGITQYGADNLLIYTASDGSGEFIIYDDALEKTSGRSVVLPKIEVIKLCKGLLGASLTAKELIELAHRRIDLDDRKENV